MFCDKIFISSIVLVINKDNSNKYHRMFNEGHTKGLERFKYLEITEAQKNYI